MLNESNRPQNPKWSLFTISILFVLPVRTHIRPFHSPSHCHRPKNGSHNTQIIFYLHIFFGRCRVEWWFDCGHLCEHNSNTHGFWILITRWNGEPQHNTTYNHRTQATAKCSLLHFAHCHFGEWDDSKWVAACRSRRLSFAGVAHLNIIRAHSRENRHKTRTVGKTENRSWSWLRCCWRWSSWWSYRLWCLVLSFCIFLFYRRIQTLFIACL